MAVLIPRRHYGDDEMGQISEFVTVTNPFDPTKQLNFKAVVDTGAFGLTLPLSWKDRLGPFHNSRPVELEMADQHRIPAEVCGPVDIKLQGFASVSGEVVFMDGQDDSKFEPLIGFMVLEAANAAVDLLRHKLIPLQTYDLKPVATG